MFECVVINKSFGEYTMYLKNMCTLGPAHYKPKINFSEGALEDIGRDNQRRDRGNGSSNPCY